MTMTAVLALLTLTLAALGYLAAGIYINSKSHASQDVLQGLMGIVLWPLVLAGLALTKSVATVRAQIGEPVGRVRRTD